ncbi:putative soluble pyridine nucleotide transhydrogenase [Candidatus Nitrospira nitrosa]|uniref:Soluble pyridine nucleotide transhydrogenase n=1 Tax=Candidatus Nitrospira nitrosa TaxID=1742972 RepID=A0A0S4LMZ4_9BACT|nr:Si-specific NAD(P)(+) transhydrogenase [Candidatus Nitrospira nitrosa]CUS38931.1 putative soluble pyridine nucleotide transhydrogenase [Candidatus Nitrospira nitrosa]
MSTPSTYDIIVIGAGPAGQKAAVQGAKAGKRVALIERERGIGGSCVYRGTIPSKTLRESALHLDRLKRAGEALQFNLKPDTQIATLLSRLEQVVQAHDSFMSKQLRRNGISLLHGRARFVNAHTIEMQTVDGASQLFTAGTIVVATGSRPRNPKEIPVDHEHILDSDSLLSMLYLPQSLAVIGGGVIGCEYASIFALLGVEVTLIDRAPYPLQFMDKELVEQFVKGLEHYGSHYLGESEIVEVRWDGVTHVVTTLKSGTIIKSEKMLVALGRQANIEDLDLEAAGLSLSDKGLIPVNQSCQTNMEHIYAVGDMVSGPALASKAMEQGRRAVRHALNLPVGDAASTIPLGIYTIPEMASIGLDEMGARERYKDPLIGRAKFEEIARAQISGAGQGLLKMIADPAGERLLGVQVVGDSATELVHLGQLALQNGATVESFIDNVFNFPTYAEAYRIAALDILGQVAKRQAAKAA